MMGRDDRKPRVLLFFALLLSAMAMIMVSGGPAYAAKPTLVLIYESMPAMVDIEAQNIGLFRSPAGGFITAYYSRRGAGVIIDSKGLIVTNAHTVSQANRIRVTLSNGKSYYARKVWVASGNDIAFLRIVASEPLVYIPLSDSDSVKPGDAVYTVGRSDLLKGTIMEGKITGLGKNPHWKVSTDIKFHLIQTSLKVYKGDSGAPVLDRNAELLGIIVAAKIRGRRASYILPSEIIKEYYSAYLKGQPQ